MKEFSDIEKVCVLMSTYNGEKFLKEQLDSLVAQEGVDISILVRDDGSTDHTTDILKSYEKNISLIWYEGRNLGWAQSFMDLIYQVCKSLGDLMEMIKELPTIHISKLNYKFLFFCF